MAREDWEEQLLEIEHDLIEGSYRPGPWQKLRLALAEAPVQERREVSDLVTRVSNLLHARKFYLKLPFIVGYLLEVALLVASSVLLLSDGVLSRLAGVVLLALCLQPLIKVTMGLVLGVRYAYVYLWYVEPRFKMAFGTYLQLTWQAQCALHLAGSLGTPLALFVGALVLGDQFWLHALCFAGFAGALLLQVGAFVLVLLGVRKVGPFLLTTLTTPATLAEVYMSAKSR